MWETSGRTTAVDPPSPIAAVHRHELPTSVEPLIEDYDEIVGDRDRFLWKWLHHLFPAFTLSCIEPGRENELRDAKLVASVFVAVVDDLAELRGDRETFEEAAKIPFDHRHVDPDREGADEDVLAFLTAVWDRFAEYFDGGPRAAEFGEMLRFDVEQVLTAIDYSSLVNRHLDLFNTDELWRYDSYNMMLFVYADVDLAYAPSFETTDLSQLRRTLGRAQRLARVGNWITTWQRELGEGDVSSGVVAYALERNVVSVDELEALQENPTAESVAGIARRIQGDDVVTSLSNRWVDEYARAAAFESTIESVDVTEFLEGIETVLQYHVASEGWK